MEILIKSVTIKDSGSEFNNTVQDILIENGVITKIGQNLTSNATVITGENNYASPGFMDLFSVIREPGNEHQDTIDTLQKSAATGGFTTILGISGSTPPLDNKSQIKYLQSISSNNIVDLLPVGTVTDKQEGKEITEMYDMHTAGAVAFSDGKKYLQSPELLKRALLYTKPFGGKIICYCEDSMVANQGFVNESASTATLGLKVRPDLAEHLAIKRDLYIAEYAESPIHITGISSAKSVQIIRQAKSEGIQVTCDVNILNLYYTDEALESFNTNLKVMPPLRTKEDQEALIKGLTDGTIDAVSSGHSPKDIELKFCEFDNADFGATTLESFFGSINQALLGKVEIDKIVELISTNPRKLHNQITPIAVGEKANITVFETNSEYVFDAKNIKSLSKNNPFVGSKLRGSIVATINNNAIYTA